MRVVVWHVLASMQLLRVEGGAAAASCADDDENSTIVH